MYIDMRNHFKSRFPAFSILRQNKPVAIDTIYSDSPDVGNGSKFAQIFVGRTSLVTFIYTSTGR
jgi:hypothetical protein